MLHSVNASSRQLYHTLAACLQQCWTNKLNKDFPPTLRVGEIDDVLIHENVDLLNAGDGVDSKPLQRVLQPLVICAGGLVHRLLLSARSACSLFVPGTAYMSSVIPVNSDLHMCTS